MKALYTAALCSGLLLGTLGHAQTTPGQTAPAPQSPSQTAPAPQSPSQTTPSQTTPAQGTPSTTTPAVSPTVLCGLAQDPGQTTTSGQTTGSASDTSSSSSPAGSGAGSTSGTGTGTSAPGNTTPSTGTSTGSPSGSGSAPTTPSTSGGTSTGTPGNTGTPGSATSATGTTAPATGTRLSATDTCFAEQAALSDQFEIQSSQLAAAQAANARVKAIATQIITDHTAATRQLSALAPQLGLRLPTALTGPKLTELAALRTSKGDAFDRAYVNAQVTAHEQAVNLFRAYGKSGGNAELRAHGPGRSPPWNVTSRRHASF